MAGISTIAIAEDVQKQAAILDMFWSQSMPKGRCLCNREKLTEALSIGETVLPEASADGTVHRDDVLAWLFGKAPGSQALFGQALKTRASSLQAHAERAPYVAGLDKVWMGGQPPAPASATPEAEEALWQWCLLAFGGSFSATMRAARHFQKVTEADFDANKVLFPHKILRQGLPKPMPALPAIKELTACDANALPFPAPGSIGADGNWAKGADAELGQFWLKGLARTPEELRGEAHSSAISFDMALVPWTMKPAGVIKEEQCTESQLKDGKSTKQWQQSAWNQLKADPVFFEDGRYLRSCMHSNAKEFDSVLQPWRMMEDGIVKADSCTDAQLQVFEQRAKRGPLSAAQMQKRRAALQKRLCKETVEARAVVDPHFFEEIAPVLETNAAIAAMRARWATDEARAAREYDETAERGAQFVAWPTHRRWPKPCSAWVQHGRWFTMWRRSRRSMQAEARKIANAARMSVSKRVGSKSSYVNSEASWEAVSECSDSSWLAVSECSDASWLELATESELASHCEAKVAEVRKVKEESEQMLAQAMPALQSAVEALNCLSKSAITEMKSMKSPPAGVILVVKALCFCFDIKTRPMKKASEGDYWTAGKKLLGDASFLLRLMNYDKDNMSRAVIQKLLPLEADPAFHPDQIKKQSCAAHGICIWVRSLIVYDRVSQSVLPQMQALQQAQADLKLAQAALDEIRGVPATKTTEAAACPVAVAPEVAPTADLPTLERGMAAVRSLKLAHLQEIKSLAKPPVGVKLTMEALCIVFGIAPTRTRSPSCVTTCYWKVAQKQLLADPVALLARMFKCQDEKIPAKSLKALERYVRMEEFVPEQIKKASLACEAICLWVRAVYKHNLDMASAVALEVTTDEAVLTGMQKAVPASPCTTIASPQDSPKSEYAMVSSVSSSPTPSPRASLLARQLEAAMNHLSRQDVQELKSLSKPPRGIESVCAAVQLLADVDANINVDEEGCVSDSSWKGSQTMMGNPSKFIEQMKSIRDAIDAGKIAPGNIESARRIQQQMGADFSKDSMAKKSKAAAGFCDWISATIMYYDEQVAATAQ